MATRTFVVKGCPVADGKHGCITTCAGGWPGTKITTSIMTQAVINGTIKPERLGCGILQENASRGMFTLNRWF